MPKPSPTDTGTSPSTATSDSSASPIRKRSVILVCGPPCAGKSTFAVKNAAPDDTILDLDVIAQKLGSPVAHGHEGVWYGRAEKHYWDIASRIRVHRAVRAFVIRCAPEPEERKRLALAVRATRCIVLIPPIQVAAARARVRDVDCGATIDAISSWYGRFRPAPFDEIRRNG